MLGLWGHPLMIAMRLSRQPQSAQRGVEECGCRASSASASNCCAMPRQERCSRSSVTHQHDDKGFGGLDMVIDRQ
jgi:hypothetical protein